MNKTCYCGDPLPKGRTRYCSDDCRRRFLQGNVGTEQPHPELNRHLGGATPNPATHCRIEGCNEPRHELMPSTGRGWRSTLCHAHHKDHQRERQQINGRGTQRIRGSVGIAYTPAEVDAFWRGNDDRGQLWYEWRKVYGLVMHEGRYHAVLAKTDVLVPLPDNATLVVGNRQSEEKSA
jgi:hypothetical protein